jgi:hypothetical protein
MWDKQRFTTSYFEQVWEHARHIESERMWIMGIWLAITAVMLKEIWMPHESTVLGIAGVKSIASVHLVITLAVLLVILKLELGFAEHMKRVSKMAADTLGDPYVVKSAWQIIRLPKPIAFVVKCFVTVRGIISIILIGGIFLDLNLISITQEAGRFVDYFQRWPVTLGTCVALIAIHEFVFEAYEKKLAREIKGTKPEENVGNNKP